MSHSLRTSFILVSALILLALFIPAQTGATGLPIPAGPWFGAIRWDAWATPNPGDPPFDPETQLTPSQWHYRLPFFATDNPVTVREDSQAIMDQEILYAAGAGIDFWAFDYYHWANPATKNPGYYGLQLYLSSQYKSRLRFVLILLPNQAYDHDTVVALFNDPMYWHYNGRPVVFVFPGGPFSFVSDVNPFVIQMVWDPTVKVTGVDAISAYSAPDRGLDPQELPYSRLMAANKRFWNQGRNAGNKVVPIVNTGWDSRPRDKNKPVLWYDRGTPTEIGSNVAAAESWVRQYPASDPSALILINAWNEWTESGICLAPTLDDGSAVLNAIANRTP